MSQNHSHITPEQYQEYLNEELSSKEAYEIEKVLQSSSLYEEAMDGFESLQPDDLLNDLDSLKEKIKIPIEKNTHKRSWLKVAAMVTLLIVGVQLLWLIIDQQTPDLQNLSDMPNSESKKFDNKITKDNNVEGSFGIITDTISEKGKKEETIVLNNVDEVSSKINEAESEKTPKPKPSSGNSQPEMSRPDAKLPPPIQNLVIEDDSKAVNEAVFYDAEDAEPENVEILEEAIIIEEDKKAYKKRISDQKTSQMSLSSDDRSIAGKNDQNSDSVISSSGNSSELKSLFVSDSTLVKNEFSNSFGSPLPNNGLKAFEEYLEQNNILLKKKRRYKAITISFLVNSDSTLSEFNYISGDSSQFNEIESILTNGPKWIPQENATLNRVTQIFWKKTEKK